MSINFPLLLVIAVAVCGLLALVDLVLLAPRRRAAIEAYQGRVEEPEERVLERLSKEPLLVEYGKSFFPVLAIVLVLRSFLVEPFQIPSGSMKPTLEVGDFILVNKFAYGIRLPVLDTKVIEVDNPQRGEVMVIRRSITSSGWSAYRVTACNTRRASNCWSTASRWPNNCSAKKPAAWAVPLSIGSAWGRSSIRFARK
jgi:signal peptidase I